MDYKNFVIYKIFNPENPDIIYIGSTKNFSKRKSSHKKNVKNKCSKSYKYPLYQYIRSLGGFEKFTIEIIEKYPCNSNQEGKLKEQEFIDLFKPMLNSMNCSINKRV